MPPLPPAPDLVEPPLPVELHRGRREAFFFNESSLRRSFRALYSASRSSMVRTLSSTALSAFSSTTVLLLMLPLVVSRDVAARSSEDGERDLMAMVEAVAVGRKSASSSMVLIVTNKSKSIDICSPSLLFGLFEKAKKRSFHGGFPFWTQLYHDISTTNGLGPPRLSPPSHSTPGREKTMTTPTTFWRLAGMSYVQVRRFGTFCGVTVVTIYFVWRWTFVVGWNSSIDGVGVCPSAERSGGGAMGWSGPW